MLTCIYADAEPTPFQAVYKAVFRGFPISATGTRELKKVDGDKFLFTSSAKSFFASVTEQSLFTWKTRAIPLEYQYTRRGIGKNRKDRVVFDWQKNTAKHEDTEYEIAPGTLDRLLYQLQMRDDLILASKHGTWPAMYYDIADKNGLGAYEFAVTGEEVVNTPIGDLNTVKATLVREDSERITTFWLAPDYDFLLVRFHQVEDGKNSFELLLKEADFNGQPVKGL